MNGNNPRQMENSIQVRLKKSGQADATAPQMTEASRDQARRQDSKSVTESQKKKRRTGDDYLPPCLTTPRRKRDDRGSRRGPAERMIEQMEARFEPNPPQEIQ